jgi:hypothetical protein
MDEKLQREYDEPFRGWTKGKSELVQAAFREYTDEPKLEQVFKKDGPDAGSLIFAIVTTMTCLGRSPSDAQ